MKGFIKLTRKEVGFDHEVHTWSWVVCINHIVSYSDGSIALDNREKVYNVVETEHEITMAILNATA